MTKLGGVPVVRDRRSNFVKQMAELFDRRDDFALTVATEGTRRRTEFWKSGFYHIAREAGVPVVLGYLDYGAKVGGFGPALELTGDVPADMDRIRGFYEGKTGFHPANFVRLVVRCVV